MIKFLLALQSTGSAPRDCNGLFCPPYPSPRGHRTNSRLSDTCISTEHIILGRELDHTFSLRQYLQLPYTVEPRLRLYHHDLRVHLPFLSS